MDTLSYKTLSANKETANKVWFVVDAEGQTLGRMASKVAKVLRGKYKTNFTPHADCGDYVIIINAGKIVMTGNKMEDRRIFSHTGYPGGQRTRTAAEVMARKPFSLMEEAVRGMLPKNTLGRALFRNMHVYVGANHKHEAQQPTAITFND